MDFENWFWFYNRPRESADSGLDWEINILGRIHVLVEYVVTLTLDQTSFTLHDKKSEQL